MRFVLGGNIFQLSKSLSKYYTKVGSCFIWTKALTSDGYGKLRVNRKTLRAHRVAYALACGDFDQSLLVCHTCDNPKCVNPKHLFLGTDVDNMRDMVQKERNVCRKGETHPLAKITVDIVQKIRKEYIPKVTTYKMLADKYGVSKHHVGKILRGERWKNAEL